MINFLIVKQLVKDTREMGVDEHEWKSLKIITGSDIVLELF